MEVEIHGTCDTRFSKVQAEFAEGFRSRDELGASLSVTLDGLPVVDLWAGYADSERSQPWQRDTIAMLYSATKGMVALCAHQLADRGFLDLDAPVADYWPEFAAAGKSEIPVSWLLCHRSGLHAIREPLPPEALYDWDAVVGALAAAEPWWTPGEQHAYQAVTFGWLVGEVVRRVSGRSLGTYFREEIAKPFGVDLHIGLGDAEIARTASVTQLSPPPEFMDGMEFDPESPLILAFANPAGLGDHNDPRFRRAEVPGINGHAGAHALARVYGALACGGELDGQRLLSPEAITLATREQVNGPDGLMGSNTRFGLGFMLSRDTPESTFGSSAGFGHAGAGGSLGFADPKHRLGFGYVPNRLGPSSMEFGERAVALVEAVYSELEST